MIDASKFTKFGQLVLSLGIRLGAIAVVAGLDYLSKVYLNFGIPEVYTPFVGVALAEADTWAVKWEKSVGVE